MHWRKKKTSPLLRLLGYFWGPIRWMIEVAAVLSAVVQHWADFWIIMALLLFNAGVGFWQEFIAGNAVEALKKQLALRPRALRDGSWQEIDAKLLVPGDVIRIRLGDVIPADVKLIEGDYLSVDQSALTGESLPVTKRAGDEAYSGTVVKQGEVVAEVSATTDAARAAADLVLTAPGLSVIVNAIEEARRIFERMNAYAVYRICETIRIMFFVVLTMVFFDFYPITAIMIILLAFFNDVPIMTIAYDHTGLEKKPVRWNMRQVITVATSMGIVGVIGSFGMLLIAMDWLKLDVAQIQTYVFLKMAVAGHLVLFAARTKEHFWKRPWPAPVMVWSAVITKLAATVVAAYGFGLITPISWPEIALIWGYSITSALVTDLVKVQVYRHMQHRAPRQAAFLAQVKKPCMILVVKNEETMKSGYAPLPRSRSISHEPKR